MIPPNTPILTRKQAADAGLRKYWTGRPCKFGHHDFRSVAGGTCMKCARDYQDRFRNGRVGIQRMWKRAGLVAVTVYVPASAVSDLKAFERDRAGPVLAAQGISINPGDTPAKLEGMEGVDQNLLILAAKAAGDGFTAFKDNRGNLYRVSDFI